MKSPHDIIPILLKLMDFTEDSFNSGHLRWNPANQHIEIIKTYLCSYNGRRVTIPTLVGSAPHIFEVDDITDYKGIPTR